MTTDAPTMNSGSKPGKSEHPDTVRIQTFGFWIYLMSDLVLFSALFATFAVLGHNYAGGPSGKDLFDLPYLFGETMFLLFSSATYGLAMLAMHDDKQGLVLAVARRSLSCWASVSSPWRSMSSTA